MVTEADPGPVTSNRASRLPSSPGFSGFTTGRAMDGVEIANGAGSRSIAIGVTMFSQTVMRPRHSS